jgi:beta-lactamase class D
MVSANTLILSIIISIQLSANLFSQNSMERNDFKKFYDQFNVTGSFVLYNQNEDKYIFYNPSQFKQTFTPASTFKICNSLIGLETGIINDENFVIPWDSIKREVPSWNQDHNLESAFKHSAVWYYQELARRVGGKQMKLWLDRANYGNRDTSGGIDQFWLSGDLRISPEEQINFLRHFQNYELPFSKRSIDIVKKIMITKDTLDFVIKAKTGWGKQENKYIGWYVGYLEVKRNIYYFVNCIQESDFNNKDFAKARINIVYKIFDKLGLVKNKYLQKF